MSATIIKLGSALTTPNNIKVKTDPLDYPQLLLQHDWSKVKTYPSQAAIVPDGTEFINNAKSGSLTGEGFVTVNSSIGFDSAGKRLVFDGGGTSNPGDKMRFGSLNAPCPQFGFEGQTTDLLVVFWIKRNSAGAAVTQLIWVTGSSAGLTGNDNNNIVLGHGYIAGTVDLYLGGKVLGGISGFAADTWTQFAVYARCTGYNGKTGLSKVYKNGAVFANGSGTFSPTAFLPSNNTVTTEISPSNTFNGSLGRISVMSGLDVAGLDPLAMVQKDYAYGSQIWV